MTDRASRGPPVPPANRSFDCHLMRKELDMKRIRVLTVTALVALALMLTTLTGSAAYREVPVPREAQRLGVWEMHMNFPDMRATLYADLDTDPDAACAAAHSGEVWSAYPATPDSDTLVINCGPVN